MFHVGVFEHSNTCPIQPVSLVHNSPPPTLLNFPISMNTSIILSIALEAIFIAEDIYACFIYPSASFGSEVWRHGDEEITRKD